MHHKPRLLSGNGHRDGPYSIASELADYIEGQAIGMPGALQCIPRPRAGSRVPGDLEAHIGAFVEHCDHRCYQESLDDVNTAGAYSGSAAAIIQKRETIKRHTKLHRRLQHRKLAAHHQPTTRPTLRPPAPKHLVTDKTLSG